MICYGLKKMENMDLSTLKENFHPLQFDDALPFENGNKSKKKIKYLHKLMWIA